MPPPETLLGTAELWSPTARGGGWATAAALLVLLLSVLLLLRRRCLLRPETSTASGSGTGVERLVTENDLRQLVSSLGVGAREPERESWVRVIAKGNDTVPYRAWCDKTTVASRESERAERATLVIQEKLQLATNRMKLMRLPNLWIRPVFGGRGRKLTGTLEAHVNGFRYSTSRSDERVDIMYGNIKHAFFQPTEKEMITLLHFHLHNHIMVGNKKTKDVQFYVEVMDVVQTLGGSRRSALDPDEIEEKQRVRDLENRINMEFQNFVNKVNDHWSQPQFKGLDLEFDMPVRELGFLGVPYKASAFIIPTSACLVELIETPFLVVTLSEIEIVNLERIGFGQKNIDMAIVFKDFKKDVLRIDSIPSTSLDSIKEWLDTTDLKYYESRLNLNWRPILKTITDDPQKFVDDGGWEFLNMEGSESESEGTEESDQGYEPSDAEPESDSEEEDSDSESLVESDEDDEDDSGEESEEKGKTWDELEREASHADREKGAESDSE